MYIHVWFWSNNKYGLSDGFPFNRVTHKNRPKKGGGKGGGGGHSVTTRSLEFERHNTSTENINSYSHSTKSTFEN